MLKSLLKSVRQYKTASLLTPILVAAEVVLECLLPFIMAELIDEMTGTSMTPIIKYGSVLIIMAILSLIFGVLSGINSNKNLFITNTEHYAQGFYLIGIEMALANLNLGQCTAG